jgi:hypothetical protein
MAAAVLTRSQATPVTNSSQRLRDGARVGRASASGCEIRDGDADGGAAAAIRSSGASPFAYAFAAALTGLRAYCLMKRSVAAWASSSTICFGGDFIR